MKIGFIGDIVGRPGRHMLKDHLKRVRDEFQLDFVIANYENASHGFGLSPKNAKELLNYGVDAMTGGNHSFDKKEIIPLLQELPMVRPLNFSDDSLGVGYRVFNINGESLAVINLMGHYTMPMADNPFTKVDRLLKELNVDRVFVDFHAETTAEKRTMLMLLSGRVDMIVGTHTHVATDDYQLFNNTFYITDVGLTGCYDNIIGMDSAPPLKRALTGLSSHHKVPEPPKCKKILQMVVADLDSKKGFSYKLFESGESVTREAFYI
jgi:metallophosphoesterase (TIGR00282 family)